MCTQDALKAERGMRERNIFKGDLWRSEKSVGSVFVEWAKGFGLWADKRTKGGKGGE